MNLRDLLLPAPLLEHKELEAICRRYMPQGVDWEVKDGLINVTGNFDISTFVSNGKLTVPFGEVTAMMLNAGNVSTLAGFPKVVHGVVDIRSAWLESLEGCPQVADSIYVEANSLKSLEHGPETVTFYAVSSDSVKTFKGVSKTGIGTLSVSACNSVKTTDGLNGATFDALKLPPDMEEITEYPERCADLVYPICAGFPRLFLIEGLETMTVSDIDKTKVSKQLVSKIDEICKHVLQIEGRKRRYLEAQTQLIDSDLEELL